MERQQQHGTTGEQFAQHGAAQPGQKTGQFGQGTQQFGGQQVMGGGGQPTDVKLEEGLTDEMRVVLHDLVQSATACEWCAERCIDEGPGMSECIRLCRDVADLATLNVQFMARDSIFGPEAIQVFADAAEACAQECARHGHRHCQECAEVLTRAVQSTRKMLASFGQGGGMQGGGMQGGQPSGGQAQTGGMQTGGTQGSGMQPQGGSFQEQGMPPQGQSQPPGQWTQPPVGGGQSGQPQGQQFGGGQPQGQHYSEGSPSPGQPGTRGPPSGGQF